MSTRLYYYTGTGNSLWVARQLAERLEDPVDLISLGTDYELPNTDCDRMGIIFPVHMWGLPLRVVEFIRQLKPIPNCYVFALAVNAGQVAGTLIQLQKALAEQGIALGSGFDLLLPSNYIIWNGAQPEAMQQQLFANTRHKLDSVAAELKARQPRLIEKGPWWQNIPFSAINKVASPRVPGMDKDFWVDKKCNSCGTCARVCPAGNIRMEAGHPVWMHHCEQCLACLQWCPQEAIQYAKKTADKKRYHNPEISLSDMMTSSKLSKIDNQPPS